MNIKEIIRKHKVGKDPMNINWRELAMDIAKEVTEAHLKEMAPEIQKSITAAIDEFIKTSPPLKGDAGVRGFKGEAGKDGKPGRDGVGKIGKSGKDGKDGKPGKDGKNGSPDKPKEIAVKLNTLNEAVDRTVIRGLEKTLENIFRSIKNIARQKGGGARGGGMGNWEHEVFSTSSATTMVTLAKDVAAGGSAILVRYQGQLLAHGVQYTILGRVITFTFTLQDSTFVEVTYVRT